MMLSCCQGWDRRQAWDGVCRRACPLECRLPSALPPLQTPNHVHPHVTTAYFVLDPLLMSMLCLAGASGHAAGTPRDAGPAAIRAGDATPGHAGRPSSGHGSRNAAAAVGGGCVERTSSAAVQRPRQCGWLRGAASLGRRRALRLLLRAGVCCGPARIGGAATAGPGWCAAADRRLAGTAAYWAARCSLIR